MGRTNLRRLGAQKELAAAEYLSGCGYRILEHNFYSRIGEIDLVASEGGYLVFVEVKYRRTNALGYPEEAVTPAKQRAVLGAARYYMFKNGYPPETPCRFDVVAVMGEEIRLIKNAFEG